MTPRSGLRIATIDDVDVRVAPSWLLIAVAVVWTYQQAFVTDQRSLATTLSMGLAAAVLFTASVLVHELAHALEGRHRGVEVAGITLFLLGGATALRDPDRRPADELAIAAIGPWSNIVLAAAFGLVAVGAGDLGLAAVADVAGVLGWLNLGLAAFNLIPGAPLDGGRVLRAVLWRVTGDRHRATTIAAVVGMLLALALVGSSAWLVTTRPGATLAAVWIGLIGAYVLYGARVELTRGRLAAWLSRRTVEQLAPPTPRVAPTTTGTELTGLLVGPEAHRVVLVDDAGEPAGVVRAEDLPEDAAAVTAAELAAPLEDVPVLAAGEDGSRLAGLLDRDQPLVLVTGPTGTWLSTLFLVDQRITALRDGGEP